MSERAARIVLNVDSSDSDRFSSCYALVDLTPAVAEGILKRIERVRRMAAEDKDLWSVYFWDCQPDYFEYFEKLENLEDAKGDPVYDHLEKRDYAIIEAPGPETPKGNAKTFVKKVRGRVLEIPEDKRARTECDQLIVTSDGQVSWMCYPKHCDGVELTTRAIEHALLEQVAGRKLAPAAKKLVRV